MMFVGFYFQTPSSHAPTLKRLDGTPGTLTELFILRVRPCGILMFVLPMYFVRAVCPLYEVILRFVNFRDWFAL